MVFDPWAQKRRKSSMEKYVCFILFYFYIIYFHARTSYIYMLSLYLSDPSIVKSTYLHTPSQNKVESSPSWSAREQDELELLMWLHNIPERVLFISGPPGAGQAELVAKVETVELAFHGWMEWGVDWLCFIFHFYFYFPPGYIGMSSP